MTNLPLCGSRWLFCFGPVQPAPVPVESECIGTPASTVEVQEALPYGCHPRFARAPSPPDGRVETPEKALTRTGNEPAFKQSLIPILAFDRIADHPPPRPPTVTRHPYRKDFSFLTPRPPPSGLTDEVLPRHLAERRCSFSSRPVQAPPAADTPQARGRRGASGPVHGDGRSWGGSFWGRPLGFLNGRVGLAD